MDKAAAQRALIALGYDLGKGGPSGKGDDDIWGAKSVAACAMFQRGRGLAATGALTTETFAALQAAVAGKPAVASRVVPLDWMPPAHMSRIIVHWTAGQHNASSLDRGHYHLLIEGDGSLVRGTPSIALNDAGGTRMGYAAHTLNCNTGSIGVSLCCMAGAIESPFKPGPSPMTRQQWDVLPSVLADLCRHYGIPVTPKTVLSHAEVQSTLGIRQRGKWDITRLAFDTGVIGARNCGDLFRRAAAEAL